MIARDRYSRTVALLKVLFPLAALAILSTLFLLSRAIEPDTAIPFADTEIQERLRDQQITGPFFSGTTAEGDQMSFSAQTLVTLPGRIGANRAEEVQVTLQTTKGASFEMQADVAELDISDNTATLSGNVMLSTSGGYRVETQTLTALISQTDLSAEGEVKATGPPGRLTAGNLRVFTPKSADSTQMVFSGGVKLVYSPN